MLDRVVRWLLRGTDAQSANAGTSDPQAPPRLTDDEVVARARAASNGAKFSALLDRGDTGPYGGDDSAADLALCALLAFWTRDPAQLDSLVRRSGLYRPKWERTDYRERTIARALEGTRSYDPARAQCAVRSVCVVSPVRGRRPVV
ncbi:MAG: hypothetical protein M3450_07050, partial [Actinomycetota bacterium]|nr:hypothetical protein [Actinomycetota bacterium]